MQRCAEEASAAGHPSLDAEENSLSESDFQLERIELSGLCDCKVRLYSGKNLRGCYAETMIAIEWSSEIRTNEIWSRRKSPQSFSVVCESLTKEYGKILFQKLIRTFHKRLMIFCGDPTFLNIFCFLLSF